jgi:hypothetical protein
MVCKYLLALVNRAIVFINTSFWSFNGTSLKDNDIGPPIVGVEYDRVFETIYYYDDRYTQYQPCPPCPSNGFSRKIDAEIPKNLIKLAESTVENSDGCEDVANVTFYTANNGAKVFSAGTIIWSWGLEAIIVWKLRQGWKG